MSRREVSVGSVVQSWARRATYVLDACRLGVMKRGRHGLTAGKYGERERDGIILGE